MAAEGAAGAGGGPRGTGEVVVVKLGGGVLVNEAACVRAAGELYGHIRAGRKVVAVVSAMWGATDSAVASAERVGSASDDRLASMLASVEQITAELVGMALARIGVANEVAGALDGMLLASGDRLRAEPRDVDVARLRASFNSVDVVVVPGFVAAHENGGASVLGFGGSDLTALFVAGRLGASCELVSGCGPVHCDADETQQYSSLSWADAEELATAAVRPEALRFASRRKVGFTLRGPDERSGTVVGAAETATIDASSTAHQAGISVAVAGGGDLAEAVVSRLMDEESVVSVVRDTDPASDLAAVVMDVGRSGAVPPAVRRAMAEGRAVVSSNVAALGITPAGGNVRCSAAVSGSAPVLAAMRRMAESGGVTRVRAVLSPASTVALEHMAGGATLEQGIVAAQRMGLVSGTLTDELSGLDAAEKLAAVARLGLGVEAWAGDVAVRGVQTLDPRHVASASAAGRVVRLVGVIEADADGGWSLSVSPVELPPTDALASARGAACVAEIEGVDGTLVVARGAASVPWAVAESLVWDVFDVAAEAADAGRGTEPQAGGRLPALCA